MTMPAYNPFQPQAAPRKKPAVSLYGAPPTGATTSFAAGTTPQPTTASAAPQAAAAGTPPLAPTNPFTSPVGRGPVPPLGNAGPMRIQDLQKRIGQFLFNNARRDNPNLWSSFQQLQGQANTDRMSDPLRAAFLGPRMEALDASTAQNQNDFARNAAARGFGDSSFLASGVGQIGQQGANARAGEISGLYQTEYQQQMQKQELLRQMEEWLQSQATAGAGVLGQARGQNLQQEQIDNSRKFDLGGFLAQALGGLGQATGMMGGFGGLGSLFGGGSSAATGTPALGDAYAGTGGGFYGYGLPGSNYLGNGIYYPNSPGY